MCWLNPIATAACETGAAHEEGVMVTDSGSGNENAPFVRWPGSLTLSAASPAVDTTSAVVDAVYVFSTPGVNAPNDAADPRVNESVAGTVPPTSPWTDVDVGTSPTE